MLVKHDTNIDQRVGPAHSAFRWIDCEGKVADYGGQALFSGASLFIDTRLSTLLQPGQQYLRLNNSSHIITPLRIERAACPDNYIVLHIMSYSLINTKAQREA